MVDTPKGSLQSAVEQRYSPLVTPAGPYPVEKVLGVLYGEKGKLDIFVGKPFGKDPIPLDNDGFTVSAREQVNVYFAPKEPIYGITELGALMRDLFMGENKLASANPCDFFSGDNVRGVLELPRLHLEWVVGVFRYIQKIEIAEAPVDSNLASEFGLVLANQEPSLDRVREIQKIGATDAILFPHTALAKMAAESYAQGDGDKRYVIPRQIRAVQKGKDPIEYGKAVYWRAMRRFPPDYSAWDDN